MYKSRKIPTHLEKRIIRIVVNTINEAAIDFSEPAYRRLLAKIIKRLYKIRNLDYEKSESAKDFTSENNPSQKRLSQTTTLKKDFKVKQ